MLFESIDEASGFTRKSSESEDGILFPGAQWTFKASSLDSLRSLEYEPLELEDGVYPEATLVTAFSENHVAEGRHLILNVSRAFPGKKVIVYGMNLEDESIHWLEMACNVELRRLNLSLFPIAEDPSDYRFKPIVVAMALKEFKAIWWMDTSTQWTGRNLSEFYASLRLQNISTTEPQVFMFGPTGHSTFAVTQPEMYYFFPPVPDKILKHEYQFGASKILFYRTKSTMDLVIKWWVLCALERFCLAPPGANVLCEFKGQNQFTEYAECHRYDQSAINLILAPYRKSFLPSNLTDQFVYTYRGIIIEESATIC